MLNFTPDLVTVRRRIDSGMGSILSTVITDLNCNIQPVSADDLIYDASIKKYILFIETDNRELLQENDAIQDSYGLKYRVDSIDWYKGPVKNTMEVILIESKND